MKVALIGRPNVGKSSLFNRLVGRRHALVWDQPGVTRDLIKGEWKTEKGPIEIWDLAGWGKFGLSFQNMPESQKQELDLLLLVIDASEALNADDFECFEALRKTNKPHIVVLNKTDKKSSQDYRHEIYTHFRSEPVTISAEQKQGMGDLEDRVLEFYKAEPESKELEQTRRVLILGRPNVGKSSLINCLAKETISFVSDQAGTTRDTLAHKLDWKGVDWEFVDSAGLRKKSKIYGRKSDVIEIFSTEKAINQLEKADFCVCVIEAHPDAALHSQDKKILSLIRKDLIPTILVVNKWDLVRKKWDEKDYRDEIRHWLGDLDFVPILFTSAITGFHVNKIFQLLREIEQRHQRIPTPKLNAWLKETTELRSPRVAKRGTSEQGIRTQTQFVNISYMTQTGTRPMSFIFFSNAPQAVAEADKRFLQNQLRKAFKLEGLPLRFFFRKKK